MSAPAVSPLRWVDFERPILFGFEKFFVVLRVPFAPDKENSVYRWIIPQIRQDTCFQKLPVFREMERADAAIQGGKAGAYEIAHSAARARDDAFHSQH